MRICVCVCVCEGGGLGLGLGGEARATPMHFGADNNGLLKEEKKKEWKASSLCRS